MIKMTQRDTLHHAIDKLPENTLIELAKFIEFLRFKVESSDLLNNMPGLADNDSDRPLETGQKAEFNPVYFPEGILKGFDFSPEYISAARKQLWAGVGATIE